MFPTPEFVKEGDGRYDVYVSIDQGGRERVGIILGRSGHWSAEDKSGFLVGTAKSKVEAYALIGNKIIEDVSDNPEYPGFRNFRQTFEEYFQQHNYRDHYLQEYGREALPKFAEGHLREWLLKTYPDGGLRNLDVKEALSLARTLATFNDASPRDIMNFMVLGEARNAWRLPIVQNIVTPSYWQAAVNGGTAMRAHR